MLIADTLVVFDLEFTTWEGFMASGWSLPGKRREVVQIGAVRLDAAAGFAETGAFQALVRPRLHPRLSTYFIELTGIDQEMVDRDGRPFPEAMGDFVAFLEGSGTVQLVANGLDGPILADNCGWHDLPVPPAVIRTLDVSNFFTRLLGRDRHVTTSQLSGLLGFPEQGRAHDGLADARTLGAALRHLRAQGRL
ncbi:MAG: exonuclease domain-containing protein [Magnetospirillum sp. WYHS-4]